MGTGKHAKRRNANRTSPRREHVPSSRQAPARTAQGTSAAQSASSKPVPTARPSSAIPPRAAKFAACADMLRCPVCGARMRLAGSSLTCERGHDFAISRKGTVNFLTRPHPSEGYDHASFENRRLVFEAGYYDHVIEGIARFFDERPELRRIMDVGCGEGFYAKRLLERTFAPSEGAGDDGGTPEGHRAASDRRMTEDSGRPDGLARTVIGLDLSKDAVGIAARGGNDACWIVGDLASLPVRDASVDAVLNVFTPAQYAEFARVLAPDGLLVKVVPGPNHLRELRHAFRDVIRHEEYSNQRVIDHFQRHFHLVERTTLSKATPTEPDTLRAFVRMTPLLFGVDDAVAESRAVGSITVEAEVLVGRAL